MNKPNVVAPKKFQQATIRAVLAAFDASPSPRRFLVADEPGLGKTVVARGVIQAMEERLHKRPLIVFYVCSNQSIASQNVEQLISFLDEGTRDAASAKADRPGLLPVFAAPAHPKLHVYSITPGTASSSKKRGLGRGKVQERALACALIEAKVGTAVPWLRDILSWDASAFPAYLKEYSHRIAASHEGGDRRLKSVFTHFHAILKSALAVAPQRSILSGLKVIGAKRSHLTAVCRNALAAAALAGMQPDLVIFDEFQRFRELMREVTFDHDNSALAILNRKILDALTGNVGDTRLLLLSATPYEAMRLQHDAKRGAARSDFFSVLDFLHYHLADAGERTEQIRKMFEVVENELRQGEPLSSRAIQARATLTSMLREVMCRTERPRFTSAHAVNRKVIVQPLISSDITVFRRFAEWLGADDSHWAVPLWTSVPLPAQTLGARYLCWKNASAARKRRVDLAVTDIAKWRKPVWPSFKARGLLSTLPVASLSMPWVRPSRPWWPLQNGWAGAPNSQEADGKVLVFSRFAAVPGAIAALASFHLECEIRAHKKVVRSGTYKNWAKPKYPRPEASPVAFQMFHVSTLLTQLDPLVGGVPGSREGALAALDMALRSRLKEAGVALRRTLRRKSLPLHTLLISVAHHFGYWPEERGAWIAAMTASVEGATPASVSKVLARWERAAPPVLAELDRTEFRALVKLGLESPAIVAARSLQRHWPEALSAEKTTKEGPPARHVVQTFVSGSLRKYLDRPWFATALDETAAHGFDEVVRQSVLDGNLESVLDEHFWLLSMTSNASWPKRLNDLGASLTLNGGRTVVHGADGTGKNAKKGRIRCHVALPLHQAKTGGAEDDSEQAPRPDQVRHAFNTPFWPNVLVTTSVGQEGLDFHPWCRSIAHWDPARGPVDLEQREGRVDRYAGLSIRRALALNPECDPASHPGSLWSSIGKLADRLQNDNGMAPWWQVSGAETVQFYLMTDGSREVEHLRKLERGRAVYRMLIGVSDPEPLLEELETNQKVDERTVLEATLRLGAWYHENAER